MEPGIRHLRRICINPDTQCSLEGLAAQRMDSLLPDYRYFSHLRQNPLGRRKFTVVAALSLNEKRNITKHELKSSIRNLVK